MIPYGRQDITLADIAAVEQVLHSDFLTQGSAVPRFEQAIASYCSASYAVAVNSATSALHIACLALDLGSNDILWTVPNTFVASANCGRYCGANVDFVDIDPETYNLCAVALEAKLKKASKTGKLPKIVIPVHFAGQSCDMLAIAKLSDQYGFRIIEDASHAIGANGDDGKVGNCKYSDITVFSFHPVKIITTAEGGLATTNDSQLFERMSRLRSHGITRDVAQMQDSPDGAWSYQQIELGYNYRMTDIQAALGASQMQRLDDYIARRHTLAQRYDEELKSLALKLPKRISTRYSALHLYPVQVNDSITRKRVFNALRHADIGVNVHYIPVHRQPYYQNLGFKKADFPIAEAYYDRAISLPMYPTLNKTEQDKVMMTLKQAL